MFYVLKNVLKDGLVADADKLMREFYDARAAVAKIDADNIKNNSLSWDTAYSPGALSTHRDGVTRTLASPGIPLYASSRSDWSGGATNVVEVDGLEAADFTKTGAWFSPTSLKVTAQTTATTTFFVFVSGSYRLVPAAAGTASFQVRLVVNGQPIGGSTRYSAKTNSFPAPAPTVTDAHSVPFFLSGTVTLEPCVADFSFEVAQYRTTKGDIVDASVGAVGFVR